MSRVAISQVAAITAIVIFMLSVCTSGNAEEITKECTPEAKTLHIGMTAWELEHCWPPLDQYVKRIVDTQRLLNSLTRRSGQGYHRAQGHTFTVYESQAQVPPSGVSEIYVDNGRVTRLVSAEATRKCRPDAKTLHIGMTAWELEHCWPPFSQYVKVSEKPTPDGQTMTVYKTGETQAAASGATLVFVTKGRVFYWVK